jgi:hypothetical protein
MAGPEAPFLFLLIREYALAARPNHPNDLGVRDLTPRLQVEEAGRTIVEMLVPALKPDHISPAHEVQIPLRRGSCARRAMVQACFWHIHWHQSDPQERPQGCSQGPASDWASSGPPDSSMPSGTLGLPTRSNRECTPGKARTYDTKHVTKPESEAEEPSEVIENMVSAAGFEPATHALKGHCSTS